MNRVLGITCAAALLSLSAGCDSDVNIYDPRTDPVVSLDDDREELPKGVLTTVTGNADDEETEDCADLQVTWAFRDANDQVLDTTGEGAPDGEGLELGDNCFAPPDNTTTWGRVSCSFRTPSDQGEIIVVLSARDSDGDSGEASRRFGLDQGAAPSCTLASPPAEAPEGAYFSDVDILLDGSCSDANGESEPEDLELWFESTYQDADGQTVTLRYEADGGDDDDTAIDTGYLPELESTVSGDQIRLYGYVELPAGTHNLCLRALDEAGNSSGSTACVALTVRSPNTAPWCEIIQPYDGTTGNVGDEVYFEGLVWDDDPDQDITQLYVEWRSNQLSEPLGYGTPDENGFVSLNESMAFSDPETHTITLYVMDDWGGDGQSVVDYTVGDGPSVWIDSPLPLELLDVSEVIVFEGHYEDGQTDCDGITRRWWYQYWDDDGLRHEVELSPAALSDSSCVDVFLYDQEALGALPETTVVIYLEVTDEDGNTNLAPVTVEVGNCLQDWYLDLDGDGYGSATFNDLDGDGLDDAVVADCSQPSGYVSMAGDCDDYAVNINPGVKETCNGLDDNCDGDIDEGYHQIFFYEDADGDGYGVDTVLYDADGDGVGDAICSSASLPGWSAVAGDCDDSQPDINPGEAEQCNDTDHDCDGAVDNGFTYAYGTSLYQDADGDGYGAAETTSCEPISGHVLTDGDCDDSDAAVNPGALEICDDPDPVDNDCDGDADPAGASGCTVLVLDADGDGYGTSAGTSACVCESNPGEYSADNTGDCDDDSYAINPAADEVCDDADTDENCDGYADGEDADGCAPYYYDADGDNYYATGAASRCLCEADGDYQGNIAGDCNDTDAAVNPGAAEVCDASNTDEDCSGTADDDDSSATGQATWYADADADGYGDSSTALSRCDQPSGYVADASDCDDENGEVNPGEAELCDGTDHDCDGDVDNGFTYAYGTSLYLDSDGDGYGASSITSCEPISGYVTTSGDCDDSDRAINPGASETVGDGVDYDCDGTEICYDDDDDDGYLDSSGDTRSSADSDCSDSYEGTVSDPTTDCNDSSASAYPGRTESCDGIDNDCDGSTDESGASGCTTYYYDYDNDGYGTSSSSCLCSSSGYYRATTSGDCNDSNASIHPGATEF